MKKSLFNIFPSFIWMRKIYYGVLVNLFFTFLTLFYTSYLLELSILNDLKLFVQLYLIVFLSRQIISFFLFDDFKLSWSKASVWTAYIKFFNNTISLLIYFAIFTLLDYNIPISLLLFEYSNFLFLIAISIYTYRYYKLGEINSNDNNLIIYGAGKAGLSVKAELYKSNVLYFIDDDKKMHYRSIDGVSIVSSNKAIKQLYNNINNRVNVSLIIAIL